MPRIAISYRRSDSLDITGRIFDRLALHYGKESIFRDIDNIRPGIDFRDQISDALAKTDVVLVVLGPRWLGRGKGVQARIYDEADPVRIELETALDRKLPVVPLLVSNARMPQPAQLPERIKEFAFRHAVTVNSGWDFDHHVDGLIRALDEILLAKGVLPGPAATPPQKPAQAKPAPSGGNTRRLIMLATGSALAVIIAAAVVVYGGRVSFNRTVAHSGPPTTIVVQPAESNESTAEKQRSPPSVSAVVAVAPSPKAAGVSPEIGPPNIAAPAKLEAAPTRQVNPAISISPPGSKKVNPIAGMPFTLGDNYAAFKAFYPTAPGPKSSSSDSSTTVDLAEINAEFFFTNDQTLYRMWLGPRFKGSVLGVEIGDPRATVVQKLGQPQRYRGFSPAEPTDIVYDFPDKVSIAFQLDISSDKRTNGLLLFDDSIRALGGLYKYTPPPPPPPPEVQEQISQERVKVAAERLKALERTAKVSPTMQVTFGDTYELVKSVYKTTQAAVPYKKGTALRLTDVGLWFFFDEGSQIRTIRFDVPFAGTVAGIKIGDTRDQVVKLLGAPQNNDNQGTYYYSSATFWFDEGGHVVTIFL